MSATSSGNTDADDIRMHVSCQGRPESYVYMQEAVFSGIRGDEHAIDIRSFSAPLHLRTNTVSVILIYSTLPPPIVFSWGFILVVGLAGWVEPGS